MDQNQLAWAMLESAGAGMYAIDRAGQCTFINRAAESMLGFTREECLGKDMHTLIHAHYQDGRHYPVEDCPIYAAGRTGSGIHADDEIVWRKDGSLLPVEYFAEPLRLNGETVGTIVTIQDITERKRAAAALLESDRRLRSVMDSLTAFVGLMTPDGILLDVNRASLQAINAAPGDVIGKPAWDGYWWSFSTAAVNQIKQMVATARTGKPARADVRARVGEGRYLVVDLSIVPITDAAGQVTALVPCGIDITDRYAAEQAVVRSEERFRSLVSATAAITWSTSPRGEFQPPQMGWCTFTGQTPDEYCGNGWLNAIHVDDRERTLKGWKAALAAAGTFEIEHRIRRADGTYRDMRSRVVPLLQDGQIREWAGLCVDVTDLRSAQAELAEANQAKSQFLANMSHELRTPLNAIIGYSEMLQEDAVDREPQQIVSDLKKVSAAGKHLLSLINGVLDLSKIEAGKMDLFVEDFDVAALVQEISATLQAVIARNGNELVVEVADAIGAMRSDITKVRQCLYNLLSNAAKFTENGRITLQAQPVRDSDLISFCVTDSGKGIAADQLGRLFQPFSQADASTSKKHGGTGLGLAITKRFAEMLGGSITVQSQLGAGATFTLTLPRTAPVAHPDSNSSEGIVPLSTTNAPLVLVIDDDPAARDLMERHLSKEGFATISAGNGEVGLELARKSRPNLITLDINMPGMDGWSVLQRLKADPELCDTPVVIATVIENRNLGYLLGAFDYLVKPIDREALNHTLRRLELNVPSRALIVDDDEGSRLLVRSALERQGWTVVEAEDGLLGLQALDQTQPELIVVDLLMPRLDGFGFAGAVRSKPEYDSTPMIVLTAKDLTPQERDRLSGSVESVISKNSYSTDVLTRLIRQALRPKRKPQHPWAM